MKEDTTLGERLRTLFREQGITIVSVLTAIGMIIGVVVEAVILPVGRAVTPSKPPSQGGAKEWVKKQLYKLAKLLGKKGKRKVQGVPQSQTAALPRHQEEEETDKSKQAQTEQMYEKH